MLVLAAASTLAADSLLVIAIVAAAAFALVWARERAWNPRPSAPVALGPESPPGPFDRPAYRHGTFAATLVLFVVSAVTTVVRHTGEMGAFQWFTFIVTLPLAWAFSAIVVHAVAWIAVRLTLVVRRLPR